MEWIRISTNKLKIMLSAEDARRYALNCENADYADIVTREAFREILTDVRRETDFDATEDKVYIQMYPSKEGGCELFVTKMGLLLSDSCTAARSEGASQDEAKKESKRAQTVRKRSVAFTFLSFAHLLALCRRLSSVYKGSSEVWKDESDTWWLLLTEHGNPLTLKEDFRFVREYGQMQSAEEARTWLPEHGRQILAQNAIQTLQALA